MSQDNLPNYSKLQFPLNSLNSEKLFYDKEDLLNPLHYKVRKNSKHEFGLEYETIVPSEGEVRLLGNRHTDCRYYSLGLEMCKERIIQTSHPDFTPCKGVIDAMYRCYTENKYGDELHNTIDEAKPHAMKFFDCYFTKKNTMYQCMDHFNDVVRVIYRQPDNKLIDYY